MTAEEFMNLYIEVMSLFGLCAAVLISMTLVVTAVVVASNYIITKIG